MDRKALVRRYQETPRPAGVYQILNTQSGKLLLGLSFNLAGALNRHRFQLENGMHPDKELQADWNRLGASSFTFETLDVLKPSDDLDYDPSEDLRTLKALWLEKLTASAVPLYRQSGRDA